MTDTCKAFLGSRKGNIVGQLVGAHLEIAIEAKPFKPLYSAPRKEPGEALSCPLAAFLVYCQWCTDREPFRGFQPLPSRPFFELFTGVNTRSWSMCSLIFTTQALAQKLKYVKIHLQEN